MHQNNTVIPNENSSGFSREFSILLEKKSLRIARNWDTRFHNTFPYDLREMFWINIIAKGNFSFCSTRAVSYFPYHSSSLSYKFSRATSILPFVLWTILLLYIKYILFPYYTCRLPSSMSEFFIHFVNLRSGPVCRYNISRISSFHFPVSRQSESSFDRGFVPIEMFSPFDVRYKYCSDPRF